MNKLGTYDDNAKNNFAWQHMNDRVGINLDGSLYNPDSLDEISRQQQEYYDKMAAATAAADATEDRVSNDNNNNNNGLRGDDNIPKNDILSPIIPHSSEYHGFDDN